MDVLITQPVTQRLWDNHCEKWSNCTRCSLGDTTKTHVLGRGKLPCEILFIGEAPGPQENNVGLPFVGPAGSILTNLMLDLKNVWRPYSWFITNTLACYPRRGEPDPFPEGFRAPEVDELEACFPRVLEVFQVARPRAVVLLGKSAEASFALTKAKAKKATSAEAVLQRMKDSKAIDTLLIPATVVPVWHPSYILRNGGLASKQYTLTLEKLHKELQVLDE